MPSHRVGSAEQHGVTAHLQYLGEGEEGVGVVEQLQQLGVGEERLVIAEQLRQLGVGVWEEWLVVAEQLEVGGLEDSLGAGEEDTEALEDIRNQAVTSNNSHTVSVISSRFSSMHGLPE